MQFEVVLGLEGFLADLTLESPSNAVSGEVASEVPFTWKNLLTVWAGKVVRGGL